MKRLALIITLLIWQPAFSAGCFVSNFKGAVMSEYVESKRSEVAYQWLRGEVDNCSAEKLSIIRSNSPSWLGTALNPQIEAVIEAAIEAKASEDPELLKKLFEPASLSPTNLSTASGSTTNAGVTPRQPVVSPATLNVSGGLSASVNYGNISGPTLINNTETNVDVRNRADAANQNTNIQDSPDARVRQNEDGGGYRGIGPAPNIGRNGPYGGPVNQNANINDSPNARINQGAFR